MKKGQRISLRELDKGNSFGRSLGLSAKPWIQKYGNHWQHHLAKAVSSGSKTYNGLSVPTGLRRSDADLYLKTSSKLSASGVVDKSPGKPSLIEHHYFNLKRIQNEEFFRNVQKGVKRHVDPNIKLIEKQIKHQKRLRDNYIDTRSHQRILDKLKKEKEKRISNTEKSYKPVIKDKTKTDKFLKEVVSHRMKEGAVFQARSSVAKKLDLLNSQFDGRDIGAAIGSGIELDEDYDRLIEFLKNGGILSRAAFMGIIRSNRAQRYIIQNIGRKFYNDNFASQMNEVKYSSDRYVKINAEYTYKPGKYRTGSLNQVMKKATSNIKDQYYQKIKDLIKKK